MILSQQAPQGRNWSNGGAGPHLNRLFPQIYALPCFVFNSDAFANAQVRQSAVAKLMRYYGTHLIKLFGFFGVEQLKLSHLQSPVGQQWCRHAVGRSPQTQNTQSGIAVPTIWSKRKKQRRCIVLRDASSWGLTRQKVAFLSLPPPSARATPGHRRCPCPGPRQDPSPAINESYPPIRKSYLKL